MYKNILLGVDGSEHALQAARAAGELARAVNSETIHIVYAYDPVPSYMGEPYLSSAIATRAEEAKTILQSASNAVGEIPGEIDTAALEGSPAETILDVANNRGADLIVMGSRGLGRLAGALLGSQSQKVVQHATCPVLIVR
jgi:nucleotide-binding universal stress UspA family protein